MTQQYHNGRTRRERTLHGTVARKYRCSPSPAIPHSKGERVPVRSAHTFRDVCRYAFLPMHDLAACSTRKIGPARVRRSPSRDFERGSTMPEVPPVSLSRNRDRAASTSGDRLERSRSRRARRFALSYFFLPLFFFLLFACPRAFPFPAPRGVLFTQMFLFVSYTSRYNCHFSPSSSLRILLAMSRSKLGPKFTHSHTHTHTIHTHTRACVYASCGRHDRTHLAYARIQDDKRVQHTCKSILPYTCTREKKT